MATTMDPDLEINLGHIDIIEDDQSLREGLSELLKDAGYYTRCWNDTETYLIQFSRRAPMVVITDMRMKQLTGLDLHKSLLARNVKVPFIYISGASALTQGIEAFKMGAIDFLLKPFSRESLLDAVMRALNHDRDQLKVDAHKKQIESAMKKLSPREREVVPLLLDGLNNAEIMEKLGISLPTTKQYKMQIMQKLGARTMSDLFKIIKF